MIHPIYRVIRYRANRAEHIGHWQFDKQNVLDTVAALNKQYADDPHISFDCEESWVAGTPGPGKNVNDVLNEMQPERNL